MHPGGGRLGKALRGRWHLNKDLKERAVVRTGGDSPWVQGIRRHPCGQPWRTRGHSEELSPPTPGLGARSGGLEAREVKETTVGMKPWPQRGADAKKQTETKASVEVSA